MSRLQLPHAARAASPVFVTDMPLHSELSVCLLDVRIAGSGVHLQQLIVARLLGSLRHGQMDRSCRDTCAQSSEPDPARACTARCRTLRAITPLSYAPPCSPVCLGMFTGLSSLPLCRAMFLEARRTLWWPKMRGRQRAETAHLGQVCFLCIGDTTSCRNLAIYCCMITYRKCDAR